MIRGARKNGRKVRKERERGEHGSTKEEYERRKIGRTIRDKERGEGERK